MPTLIPYGRMTDSQQLLPVVQHAYRKCCDSYTEGELQWRLCFWMTDDGRQTARAAPFVLLYPNTPWEILMTLPLDGLPDRAQGEALTAAARDALWNDALAAKAPLLVLCDWLQERGVSHEPLLRAFCSMPQRWDPVCMETRRKDNR